MGHKKKQQHKIKKIFKNYYGFVITFLAIIIILIGIYVMINYKKETLADELQESHWSESTTKKIETSQIKPVVSTEKKYADVKGAVKHPGMYPIDKNMRVYDVIELAGGVSEEADLNQLNYAQKVSDQMVIYVLKKGEKNPIKTSLITNTTTETTNNKAQSKGKTNLNIADVEELKKLNGIGEKKAEAIKLYREENGLFKKIEDLTKVKGIGEKTFESLKQSITIE